MAKFAGRGAQFLIDTGTTTPTWTATGQVQEIGDLSITAEEVEVTTLDTTGAYRDYIQGFKDPGEIELTVMFDPALPAHDDTANGLIGLFASGETKDCAVRWNSSAAGGATYSLFRAFIRDMTYGALNADDPQSISPLWRLRSEVTFADTLPVARTPEGQLQMPPPRQAQPQSQPARR